MGDSNNASNGDIQYNMKLYSVSERSTREKQTDKHELHQRRAENEA